MLFVGWSLNYEMFFYVIFTTALFFGNRVVRCALPIAILAALVVFGEIVRPSQPELRFLTRPIILEFGLGMLLAEVYPRLPTSKRAGYLAAGILVVALLLLLPSAMIDGTRYPVSAIPSVIIVGAALVMERAGLVPVSQVGLLLGDSSYALYLTHPFVAQAVTEAAQRAHVLTFETAPLILCVIFALACITAIGVMRYVEKPLGRYARRLLEAPRIRTLSSPAGR